MAHYSRAALPFSLQERNANCTHNGVITFAFKRNCCLACRVPGQQRDLRLFQGRSLGLARRNVYTAPRCRSHRCQRGVPSTISQGECPRGQSRRWRRSGTGVDPANFAHPDEVSREHLTTWGVIVDGVHYVGGCQTRAGAYPFCDSIDLPSYSLAKSVFASAALMRLEKTHPGTRSLTAASFVAECAASGTYFRDNPRAPARHDERCLRLCD